MTTWMVINSSAIVVIAVILYLLMRQLGFVLQRVSPTGARGSTAGPRVGENLSHYIPGLVDGEAATRAKLIVFGSDACSICAQIKAGAEKLAKDWWPDADIYLIYDCDYGTEASKPERISRGVYFQRHCSLRKELGATFVPLGVVADRYGTVVGKGVVNEIAHLESLLELERTRSKEVGGEVAGVRI